MVLNASFTAPSPPQHIPFSGDPVQFASFPIGLEVRAEQKLGEEVILLSSRVTNDPKGFLYHYRIEHTGTNTYLYRWELLERVLGRNEVILDLEPGSIHEFRVVCSQSPIFANGKTEILRKEKLEDDNFTTSIWVRQESTVQAGPVPNNNQSQSREEKKGIK